MRKLTLIAGLIALAGCTPIVWVDANGRSGAQDDIQCEYEAEKAVPTQTSRGSALATVVDQSNIHRLCMQARGFHTEFAKKS